MRSCARTWSRSRSPDEGSRSCDDSTGYTPRKIGVEVHCEVVDRGFARSREILGPRALLAIEERCDVTDRHPALAPDFHDGMARRNGRDDGIKRAANPYMASGSDAA